ncbi:MAG: 16S rRNA (cytidine(1402)-2'-O)-methyltransferase [Armatimonadetes bacterium]|nr:16S rRNA (cytidine(1402)-2'-O)-methyltransferase [Armatimonadota bacterium]
MPESEAGPGALHVCATPIGNLEDITLRTLKCLRDVSLILAEDTRRTRKLLSHFDIHTPLIAFHEHNEREKSPEILDRLRKGAHIALVSDAGLPGISDPGMTLVRSCIREDLPVTVLPGASAVPTALVLSGFPTEPFAFLGFLPSKKSEKEILLRTFGELPCTLVLFEGPHRIRKTLAGLIPLLGDRQACLARELTKVFEETRRGKLSELSEILGNTLLKGEITLVLSPPEGSKERRNAGRLSSEEATGPLSLFTRDAARELAGRTGLTKKEAYKTILRGKKLDA